MRFAAEFLLAFFAFLSSSRAQVPVYEVTPVESSVTLPDKCQLRPETGVWVGWRSGNGGRGTTT
jgi:hypothetical protein